MAKKLSWKIWILIILIIIFLIVVINPQAFNSGLLVKESTTNSSSFNAGLRKGDIIQEINGQKISNLDDYYSFIESINIDPININVVSENRTFSYKSKTFDFWLEDNTVIAVYGEALEAGITNGMEIVSINGRSLSEENFLDIKQEEEPKIKIEIKTTNQEFIFLSSEELGLTLKEIPLTRIVTGLDLQGGSRALVKPVEKISDKQFESLLSVVRYRLNVYGITDVNVRKARDISGESYMVVELAGATPAELKDLVSKQGKFEAKIGDEIVFIGGNNDITFVCRNDASCSYIEGCFESEGGGQACRFHFEIQLSGEAAKRHADITANLDENVTSGGGYLNETLDLYLDDTFVDQLLIDVDLKGKEATRIAISGSGTGATEEEAYEAAQADMKELQTVLITGSLPVKLEVAKLDSVSPLLGKQFMKSIWIAIAAVFIAVLLLILIRFRKPVFVIPVAITLLSEVFLVLGIAALINWNIDLPSIAGIIAAIGTGVDDQIVMLDESRNKKYSIKERIKRAFFIIIAAFATTFVALVPLLWAGAGLLRGFAVTTLIGITVGVLITRPAFGEILKLVVKE